MGAHGMYTSEVLHLKRNFGQWIEDDANTKDTDLKFYEYVEAYKLTGSVSFPAGQVLMLFLEHLILVLSRSFKCF